MKFMKRATAWLLTLMLLMTILPSSLVMTAFAAEFEDFPTGWSAEAVRAAVDNGLIKGKTNGLLEPESNLTRAEAATIINRAFGSTVKADISSFEDVAPTDWYYEEMAKAVNMKTFVGDGSHLYPNDSITREEMFTVIARALVLSDYSSDVLKKFTDSSEISDYAVPYLAALAANGYINGNPDGTLKPKSYITREEFAQVMHNIFKTYISEAGTYTKLDGQDSVVIRAGGVTLKNVTIEKDLVLGDGVGKGDIKLENVTIKGRLLCRGGEGKVHLVKTTVGDKVVVYDVNGTVNFNNYRTEDPFKDIAEHTPATFLEKQTGGGNSSGGINRKDYEIEMYFQESGLPGKTPVYGGKDPNFDMEIRDKKGAEISLTWEKIDELYDSVSGWDGILKKYELDTAKSELEGKNDGNLVLKVYLKKKVFTVIGPDSVEYKYFYNDTIGSNTAFKTYFDESNETQEGLGYDIIWKDASGNEVDLDYKVTENGTITADTEPIPYKVIFNTNGGEPIEPKDFNVETETFPLPTPVKGDYVFVGWHKAEDLSDDIIEEITKGTIGTMTLYAEWAPDLLWFEAKKPENTETVVVDVKLTNIPDDLADLASLNITYSYDATKLTYNNTVSAIGDTLTASAGSIAWAGALSEAPANDILFTITFDIIPDSEGEVEFKFVTSELKDSANTVSAEYETRDDKVDLGGPYYTVRVYKGTERKQNLRNTIYNIPAKTKLTEAQVYANIGTPDNYKVEGYTDSYGNIHYVTPELMYNNNGTWEVFDIENTEIESDLALCMLNRTIRISLVTDRTIKGVELPEVFVEVAYDSESSISESALDGLTLAKFQMETILDLLKDEKGFDPYKSLVARLSSKGITDENGTFIAKAVALKMGDFISVKQIEGKIDEYIEDSLGDDEFIVSLLENETIVNSFLGNENLKKAFMDDEDLRDELIDEELIKEMASDPEIVEYIIASESFRQSFLNNDATFDYVMNDPSIKTKILNNADFRKVLVDECIKLVEAVYFEETKSAPELYDYIDDVLKSDEFIQKIEAEEELKYVLEDEIKDLIKNADATIKAELYAAIRGNDNLKNQIIEVIKTDATVFNGIKDVVKNDTAIRDDIKADVKADAKDTIKDSVKTWILNNIEANDTLKSEIIGYILANNTVKNAIIADNSITDAELNTYLSDNTNLIDAVETYFDNIYDLSYDDMYDTFFNDFYADADIFDKAYAEFIDDDANFKTAFETYITNDTYLDIAFNTFVGDEIAFDTFYDTYVGDDARFNELFEKYYPTHVHDVAKSAYNNGEMHDMIEDYVRDYTEDLAIEYADGTLETHPEHSDLYDTIASIMVNDMPDAVRAAYNEPGSKIKTLIDELIESNAQTLIDKYLNDQLTSDEKTIIEDAIYDYADEVAADYIDDKLDDYLKTFIDDAIETEVGKMIDDFIAGTNRDDVRKLLTDHTDEAIAAFKETAIYKDVIDIFRNKEENFVITADNLFVARGIAKAVESYTYEQIKKDFVNEKLQKLLDIVGDDIFKKYVDEAVEGFVTGLNEVCDKVDEDIENNITDSEYTYPAKLVADVNVISEILYPLYNKAMAKAKAKLESLPKTKYNENQKFQDLVNTNLLDKIFFDKTTGADGETLYTLKSDISEMYSASLEMVILAHDAVIWYEKYEDELDAKAADVAVILAGYANRLNGIIMNYIENGELPKDITLEDLFEIDGRIETAYDRVDEYIDKLLAKYEEYLDRDYEEVFEKLATGTITANEEKFNAIDIVLETKIFDVDDAFDAIFNGKNLAGNEYVDRIVSKLESAEVTPEANPARYYIDAYKAVIDNREIKGVSTGTHTIRVERYLK